jgi:hypothetical protein
MNLLQVVALEGGSWMIGGRRIVVALQRARRRGRRAGDAATSDRCGDCLQSRARLRDDFGAGAVRVVLIFGVEGNAARLTELFFCVNGLIALPSVSMLVHLTADLQIGSWVHSAWGANNCT